MTQKSVITETKIVQWRKIHRQVEGFDQFGSPIYGDPVLNPVKKTGHRWNAVPPAGLKGKAIASHWRTKEARSTLDNAFTRIVTDEEFDTGEIVDPDPLDTDIKLFSADYAEDGECGIGVGNKVAKMTGFERMIFEDGHNGSGNTQRQGMNVPQIGKKRQIETLAAKLDCTFDQAEDLLDCWTIIDDSARLWPEFTKWTQARGIDASLKYFGNLALGLTDDTVGVNESPMETMDSYQLDSLEDLSEVWDRLTAQTEAPGIDPELFERFCECHGYIVDEYVDSDETDGAWEVVDPDIEVWSEGDSRNGEAPGYCFTGEAHVKRFILNRGFSTPDTFRYATINNDIGVWHTLIANQRPWFQKLVAQIDKTRSLTNLKRLGKTVHDKKMLVNDDEIKVFKSVYALRKGILEAQVADDPKTRVLLTRLRNLPSTTSKAKLKFIAFWLYNEAPKQGYSDEALALAKGCLFNHT